MVKRNDLIETLISEGELRLFQNPVHPERVFADFHRPMFREEESDKTHKWFRDGNKTVTIYLSEHLGWTEEGDQAKMRKAEHRELIKRCKKYAEFWGIKGE